MKQSMGCTDGFPPEIYTENQLSRAVDMLRCAGDISPKLRLDAWKILPEDMMMELNWSKWTYRSIDES
jgi:hypothetical protein